MRIAVRHVTRFRFDERVNYAIHDTRLQPAAGDGQRLTSWTVRGPGRRHDWIDGYGNAVSTFSLAAPHRELEIVAEGVYEWSGDAAWISFPERDSLPPEFWLLNRGLARHEAAMDGLIEGLQSAVGKPDARIAAMHDLMDRLADRIVFRTGVSTPDSTALEIVAQGAGVCQDMAHVFIGCCRRLGVPARYASGYLRRAPGHAVGTASHGWAEAWIEGLGWVGFDPANRCSPTGDFLRLAVGLDYASAAPVTGRRIGPGLGGEMDVSATVEAI
jgi:transglutaminase-like putative cysteine protease